MGASVFLTANVILIGLSPASSRRDLHYDVSSQARDDQALFRSSKDQQAANAAKSV